MPAQFYLTSPRRSSVCDAIAAEMKETESFACDPRTVSKRLMIRSDGFAWQYCQGFLGSWTSARHGRFFGEKAMCMLRYLVIECSSKNYTIISAKGRKKVACWRCTEISWVQINYHKLSPHLSFEALPHLLVSSCLWTTYIPSSKSDCSPGWPSKLFTFCNEIHLGFLDFYAPCARLLIQQTGLLLQCSW